MNTLWTLLMFLALTGCDGSSIEPTAIQFGDSNSLGATGVARLKLNDLVDFRHDPWDQEGIRPSDTQWFYGVEASNGNNNGPSATLLIAMERELSGKHYTVLVMNAGIHDAQFFHQGVQTGPASLSEYRANIEAAAQEAEQHADYAVWVNTTPIPTIGAGASQTFQEGSEKPYNAVADDIAKEHGFYILETDAEGQKPANVHFTSHGYDLLGARIANCVITVLDQAETDICHH